MLCSERSKVRLTTRPRGIFEVDFWGAVKVSQEAVRVFREVNPVSVGGRLIVMSSGAGFSGVPAAGYYSATYVRHFILRERVLINYR